MTKYLKIERHKNDEITRDLYLIYLHDSGAIDSFMRRFCMLNRITYSIKHSKWIILNPRGRRIKNGSRGI